jgi:hypothetical protein
MPRLALAMAAVVVSGGAPAWAQEADRSAFLATLTRYDHCLFYVGGALFKAGRPIEDAKAAAVEVCEPERAAAAAAYLADAEARQVAGNLETQTDLAILAIQGRALMQLEEALPTQQSPTASN